MMWIIFLFHFVSTQVTNLSLYTIGENLVKNPSFDLDTISNSSIMKTFPSNITGWSCTTGCQLNKLEEYCTNRSYICNANFTISLDL